jgi:hypothetical protein
MLLDRYFEKCINNKQSVHQARIKKFYNWWRRRRRRIAQRAKEIYLKDFEEDVNTRL